MKHLSTLLLFFFSITFSLLASGQQEATRQVKSQREFETAMMAAQRGMSVSLNLAPGTYSLSRSVTVKGSLQINGNGHATITNTETTYKRQNAIQQTKTHYVCKLKKKPEPFSLFVGPGHQIVPVCESVEKRTGVNIIPKDIESDDTPKKAGRSVRIPISNNLRHLRNKTFEAAYGYFDCAWDVINVRIERSDRNYFYATTLNSSFVPNFSYERDPSYKKDIRYVVYNAEATPDGVYYDAQYIYIPLKFDQVSVVNAGQKPMLDIQGNLKINGVTFADFSGLAITSAATDECSISDCHFINSPGCALSLNKENSAHAKNATIIRCEFLQCALQSGNVVKIKSEALRHNCVTMSQCRVSRYPDGWSQYKNTVASVGVWADATIDGCEVWNSSRDHISLNTGLNHVNGCTLYCDANFLSHPERNLSSDFGLIYVNHIYKVNTDAINNRANTVLIESCRIYGAYAYGGNGRGIFIDDGRGDVTVRQNHVTDCQKYTLDSRDAASRFGVSSVRNVFEGNTLGGPYRLQGGKDLNERQKPIVRGNILLGNYKNEVRNARIEKQDKTRADSSKVR